MRSDSNFSVIQITSIVVVTIAFGKAVAHLESALCETARRTRLARLRGVIIHHSIIVRSIIVISTIVQSSIFVYFSVMFERFTLERS